MPPKKKGTDPRTESELDGHELEGEYSASSPLPFASSSAGASLMMTSEQLQAILEANTRSMMTLLGSRPTPVPAAVPPKIIRVEVPKWKDGDIPSQFLSKYEKAQHHNGVPREQWGRLLEVYLTGKAQGAYAQVDQDNVEDYGVVRNTILRSLGDIPEEADRKWWTLRRESGESSGAFYLRMRSTGTRRFDGITSRETMFEKVLLSRYMSLLSPECYTCVSARNPRTGEEAAALVNEFENRRDFSKSYLAGLPPGQPYFSSSHFKREQGSGESTGGVSRESSAEMGNSSQSPTAGAAPSNGSFPVVDSEGGTQVQQTQGGRRPVTCYGCGELGHIKPNCPDRIRRVISPESNDEEMVDGWLAGTAVKGMRVDTGADRSIISAEFVPPIAYLEKSVILDSWRGKQFSKHRLARLPLRVDDTEVDAVFAVTEKLDCPAILGKGLGPKMRVKLLGMLSDLAKADLENSVIPVVTKQQKVRVIREVTKQKDVQDVQQEVVEELVDVVENPLPSLAGSVLPDCENFVLDSIFDFDEDLFVSDHVVTLVEGSPRLPVVAEPEIPLPGFVGSGFDDVFCEQVVETLVLEQQPVLVLDQVICKTVIDDCLVQNLAENSVTQTLATGKISPDCVGVVIDVFHGVFSLCAVLCFLVSWFIFGEQFLLQLMVLGVFCRGVLCVSRFVPVLVAVCYARLDPGVDHSFLCCLFSLDWWRRKFKSLHLDLRSTTKGGEML